VYARHRRRYRRGELIARAATAGLSIQRVTSFVTLLLPAMYASRMRERLSRRSYDPLREHAQARRVPWLESALDLERQLIARGRDLPAGGSLLLVAKRA
jgi:hypothetical protein